jgi:mycofactocin precursor
MPATTPTPASQSVPRESREPVLVEDLIEDVSIDGMCGVY